MALFEWTRTGYGRTWGIEVGTGTSADLLVKKWPVLESVKRPTRKDVGVYPRKLTIPFVDYDSSNGYLRDAVFDSELECTLTLDSDTIFTGVIYQSDIIKAVGEDQYDTEVIVSDGLERLRRSDEFSGTYTYEEFLKELLWETGFELDIHFYTDWEEDNADAGLVDTHRLTDEGDNYMEVLQNFCNDFGYQVYQEDNVWVVRSLAYFAGASVTRYVIDDAGSTSSSVSIDETITGLYKSSEEDIIRGTGKVRVIFEWDILDEGFENDEFEGYTDDSFDGWDESGSPEQIEPNTGDFQARLNSNTDRLTQRVGKLLHSGDRFRIDAQAIAQFDGSPDGSEDAEWLQVVFTSYDGSAYYLQNDGTVTTTETILSKDSITTSDLEYNEEVIIGNTAGFTDGFYGTVDVICRFDSKFDSGSQTDYFESFDFQFVKVETDQNTSRFNKQTSIAHGSGFSTKEIELTTSQNTRQFLGNNIEYYNGTDWLPGLEWNGLPQGQKRAKDELIVRNQDMSMIRANIDYGTYNGLEKIYADNSKDYIPLTSKITVGLDDVEVVFVQHERSAETITVNDEFSNDN